MHSPSTDGERARIEYALGIARAGLASLAVLALTIDTPEPAYLRPFAYSLLALWVAYSYCFLAWVRGRAISPRTAIVLHVIDLLISSCLTVVTHGPSSPLFVLFSFNLIAAGFRWGFEETILTAAVIIVVLNTEAVILRGSTKPFHELMEGEFEINRNILRCSYIAVLGFLVGTLGENEKVRRAEATVLNRMLRAADAQNSVSNVLRMLLGEFMRIFNARRACLITHDLKSDRYFLFVLRTEDSGGYPRQVELSAEQGPELEAPGLPRGFFLQRQQKHLICYTIANNEVQKNNVVEQFPHIEIAPPGTSRVLSVMHQLGRDWRMRLFLFDANLGIWTRAELRFADIMVAQALASLHSVYLVRRMRSRIGAMERARVSRELHDGIIQSLISAEMRMEVLRLHASREAPALEPDIHSVQDLLREEVLSVRELMQQLKSVDLGPDQLLDHMAELVERFGRETGITAHFISGPEEVQFTPNTCRELVRIVQEALVNVRKHAHATQVVITFSREHDHWKLRIADNGKGFPFHGRIESVELMNSAKGPTVIKERVRAIGGTMDLESSPEAGACLEIRLGIKGETAHGE